MHDLADSNGHDNLGFNGDRNREADATSHQTTITNLSSNGTPNDTPRRVNSDKKLSKKNQEITERSVSTEILKTRKSISENTKETSFNTRRKSENHTLQNKETMKYAGKKAIDPHIKTSHGTKELKHTKSALRKAKKTTVDQKDVKRKISIYSDQNGVKHKEEVDNEKEKNEEKPEPKKKVKIKESLSQKIKKSNASAKNNVDEKVQPKSNTKPQQNTEGHKRNVKYLLDQAMEANKENNMESSTASIHKDNEITLESSQENIRVMRRQDAQDVSDTTENLNLDATSNVNCNIGMQEKDDGKVRKLERVETDDCTSIDTSTLPPPPDEILFNTQEVLEESNIEERVIA